MLDVGDIPLANGSNMGRVYKRPGRLEYYLLARVDHNGTNVYGLVSLHDGNMWSAGVEEGESCRPCFGRDQDLTGWTYVSAMLGMYFDRLTPAPTTAV